MKRVTVIAGHYGSGKTEFAVNLAMRLAKEELTDGKSSNEELTDKKHADEKLDEKRHQKVALLDMDIANPYFRSRERQRLLESHGIQVHHNTFGFDITEDLPAISAGMRGPLEDQSCITIVDVGGNDSGARVMKQFAKYFTGEDVQFLCVLNGNRPETDTVEGMLSHLNSIETETGLKFHGIVNNTHMLQETTVEDIMKGHELCLEVSEQLGIPVIWNTCREDLLEALNVLSGSQPDLTDWPNQPDQPNQPALQTSRSALCPQTIFPLHLYMRPSWLDR